jgi:hypothetical protein
MTLIGKLKKAPLGIFLKYILMSLMISMFAGSMIIVIIYVVLLVGISLATSV